MGLIDQVTFTIALADSGPRHGAARANRRGEINGRGDASRKDESRRLTLEDRKRLHKEHAAKAFEKLQHQFQERLRAHKEQVQREVAEIDVNVFFEEAKPSATGAKAAFKLNGALPPTTPARESRDIETSRAIGHSEKEAAAQLIEMRREADSAYKHKLADETRATKPVWNPKTRTSIPASRLPSPSGQTLSARAAMALSSGSPSRPCSPERRPSSRGGVALSSGSPSRPGSPEKRAASRLGLPEAAAAGLLEQDPGGFAARGPKELRRPYTAREWKDFEERIADFHRQHEFREDDEAIAVAKDRARIETDEHNLKVHNDRFERYHKRAESAIIKACKTKITAQARRQYKNELGEKLFVEWKKDHDEKQRLKDQVDMVRNERAIRRKLKNTEAGFGAKCFLVAETCREVDREEVRAQKRRQATAKCKAKKADWAARAQALRSRHDLERAQMERQDVLKRSHFRLMLQRERERIEREVSSRKELIAAERRFKAYMQELALQLVEQSTEQQASSDLQAYERTLTVLRELADGVREHSLRVRELAAMHAQQASGTADVEADVEADLDTLPKVLSEESLAKALLPVEPQVRSALSTALSTAIPQSDLATPSDLPLSPTTAVGILGLERFGAEREVSDTASLADFGVRPATAPASVAKALAEPPSARMPFFKHAPRPPPQTLPRRPAPRGERAMSFDAAAPAALLKAVKRAGPSKAAQAQGQAVAAPPPAVNDTDLSGPEEDQGDGQPALSALLMAQTIGPAIFEESAANARADLLKTRVFNKTRMGQRR